MEKGLILDLMEGVMWEIGWIIRCMDLEFIRGKMGGNMRGSIFMIGNMGRELMCGLMGRSMKEGEGMGGNMEKGWLYRVKGCVLRGFGKTGRKYKCLNDIG